MTEATEKMTFVEGPPIISAIDAYQRLLIDNHNLYQHIETLTEATKPRNKNDVLSHAMGIYCANVGEWVIHTFGSSSLFNQSERALRFMEEATELAQACGLSYARVEAVQKHVYGRAVGSVRSEIGGSIHTLAALATGMSMPLGTIAIEVAQSGWDRQNEIREKNRKKPASIRAHFD